MVIMADWKHVRSPTEWEKQNSAKEKVIEYDNDMIEPVYRIKVNGDM